MISMASGDNNKMKKILILIAMIFFIACPSTRGAYTDNREPTYVVRVKGLVCPSCAVGLRNGLIKLSFVRAIHVDYKTGITHIYEKISRDKGGKELDKMRIRKVIEEGGYKVDKFIK